MRDWPPATPAEKDAERGFFHALALREAAFRLLVLIPFVAVICGLASAFLTWAAELREARALEALRGYLRRIPKPPPRSWAKCPDACDEGLDPAGGECETCEGLARVTLQAQAAILAGRIGDVPRGDDAARRAVIRERYPTLDKAAVESVLAAWGRQGKDEAVCL